MRRLVLAVLCLLPNAALAQSFDGGDVEGFIAVMEGAEPIADRYEGQYEEEMAPFAEAITAGDLGALLDAEGQFRVFRLSAEAMGRAGDIPPVRDYRALVTGAGFGGLPEFGEKADAIMMAWMATQMDGQMSGLDELTPETMAMMPPALREQMATVRRLADAVEAVPAEDLAAIRPHRKALERALD